MINPRLLPTRSPSEAGFALERRSNKMKRMPELARAERNGVCDDDMIQIFGKAKCFDTKKAERYFKERRIKFQRIDLNGVGMSRGEFNSVKATVGLSTMIDSTAPGVEILIYLAYDDAREEKLFENPVFIRTPIVRNGKKATVGYCPEIWKGWE